MPPIRSDYDGDMINHHPDGIYTLDWTQLSSEIAGVMLAARDAGLDWGALTEMVAAGLQDYYAEIAPVPPVAGGQRPDLPNSVLATRTFIVPLPLFRFDRELL